MPFSPFFTWALPPFIQTCSSPCSLPQISRRRPLHFHCQVQLSNDTPSSPPDQQLVPHHDETSIPAPSVSPQVEVPPDVELSDVHLSLGNKPILQGLNLHIDRGESLALIGTSGTGKSTTLRVICGLLMPDKGSVRIRGWERARSLKMQRAHIRVGMVFQNAALFDSLSVAENVGFTLFREKRLPDERIMEIVDETLGRVGMAGASEMMPEELSGGMQKRVGLARAILYDPERPETAPDILLYDEPSAGLDPTASTMIENLMRSVQDVCPTMCVVTHQLSTIRRTADRVIMMHEGKGVWEGKVDELETTDNLYVRQFMEGSLDGPLTSADNRLDGGGQR